MKNLTVKELIAQLQTMNPDAEVCVKGFLDTKSTFGKNIIAAQGLKRWKIDKQPGWRRGPDFWGNVYRLDQTHDKQSVILDAGEIC